MKKTSLRTAPVARASRPGIRIKSGVKAGAGCWNHNETLLAAR